MEFPRLSVKVTGASRLPAGPMEKSLSRLSAPPFLWLQRMRRELSAAPPLPVVLLQERWGLRQHPEEL